MRKLLVFLLFVAAGYYLYTHQDLWRKFLSPAGAPSKSPYALQEIVRTAINGPFMRCVVVVDGDRWRFESETLRSHKAMVVVCDGSQVVSNIPPPFAAAKLDPRPTTDTVLSVAAKYAALAAKYPNPNMTEQRDGHTCWKTTIGFQGITGQLWIDTGTGFPVCVVGSANGTYEEVHYTRIPIDFTNPGTAEFFDPAHTESIFARYLTP